MTQFESYEEAIRFLNEAADAILELIRGTANGVDSNKLHDAWNAIAGEAEQQLQRKSQLVPREGVSKFVGVETPRLPVGKVARHCYLSLSLDGSQWCALFGQDLQSGVAAFGDTPTDAVDRFEAQFQTSYDYPPIPDRRFDWSAWVDGCEEWKIGRGATEAEAIRDLLERIEED